MARVYASVKLGIWDDDDFRALTPPAQHLYFLLLTDPKLSYCGAGDWLPKRIRQKAKGWEITEILNAALELVDNRLIVIAEDTDEYLVRSFVRHDGVMAHSKLCVSAATATREIGSNSLRRVVIGELKRLKEERPDMPAWDRDAVQEILKRDSIDGRVADLFGEGFSPALREAFSQNVPSGYERPYESPHNSNSNSSPLQQQLKDKDSSSEVATATTRPDVEAILDHLESKIKDNGARIPTRGTKARDAVRLMLDRDERKADAIMAAIDYATGDEFWRANILSAAKLREKYDQLSLNAQRDKWKRPTDRHERESQFWENEMANTIASDERRNAPPNTTLEIEAS